MSVGKLKQLFGHIQSEGQPPKATQQWLASIGFKSTNDRSMISILKFIGFVDAQGTPTERWSRYKHRGEAKRVMAEAIRTAYVGLYDVLPNAQLKDNEALRDFFAAHAPAVGQRAVDAMVATFKALCELADFEGAPVELEESADPVGAGAKGVRLQVARAASAGPVVNVNIQLTLPATDDATIYDKLFEAMKKHLFSGYG